MHFHSWFCFFGSKTNRSSTIRLKICVIKIGIKTYKSINKKNKKNYDKIISLVKSKLNITEVWIFNTLIDSNVSHDELALINNVLNFMIWKKKSKILKIDKRLNYI